MPRHIAIDVETTGLFPDMGHRVIEIGAVAIEGGRMIAEFQTLIDVDCRISAQAHRVHGITRAMLKGHPKPSEAFGSLATFIGGGALVAHNAGFDISFLRNEFRLVNLDFRYEYNCTLELSRELYPRLPNYRLDTVFRRICNRQPAPDRHRALGDATMTAEIWLKLGQKIRQQS